MASVCETITGEAQIITRLSTQTVEVPVTLTAADSISSITIPITATACTTPLAINGTVLDPICSLVTSLVPTTTVVPGAVRTTFSLSEIVSTALRTVPGAVSTTCSIAATTAAPLPSSTTTTTTTRAPRTTTTSRSRTRSSASVAVDEETLDSTSLMVDDESTTLPIDPVSLLPVDESSTRERSTITSFRTVVVTLTDANGRETILTTSSATLNTVTGSGRASNNTGAIAGGVTGGIAAIVIAVLLFLLLRRKGCFQREDEHFNDDIWMPANHSPGEFADDYGGGGGGSGGSTGHGGGGVILEEKEEEATGGRDEMVQRSRSGASWVSRDGARSMYLDSYGGSYGPHGGHQHGGGSIAAAAAAAIPAPASPPPSQHHHHAASTSLSYAASRRLSSRSMHSMSSHGHSQEASVHAHSHSRQPSHHSHGHGHGHSLPRIPPVDHRFSHEFFQHAPYGPPPPQPVYAAYASSPAPPPRPHSQPSADFGYSPSSDVSGRQATQGSSSVSSREPSRHGSHHRHNSNTSRASVSLAERRQSIARPPLAVLTTLDASATLSSAGTVTTPALDSASSARLPALSSKSYGSGSGASSAPSSASSGLATPLDLPPTTALYQSHPAAGNGSNDSGAMKTSHPQPQLHDESLLKPIPRPGMDRSYSTDSCTPVSQFLGARIVNADDEDDLASLSTTGAEREILA